MTYYLVVTGWLKTREVLCYCRTHATAKYLRDKYLLEGIEDVRVALSTKEPPKELYFKPFSEQGTQNE